MKTNQVYAAPAILDSVTSDAMVPGPAGLGTPYMKFLTVAGDGTGSNDFNVDLSATQTDIRFNVAAKTRFNVVSVLVQVSAAAAMNQTEYGSISGGLTNGITFYVASGDTLVPLLSGTVIKQNNDWFMLSPFVNLSTFAGNAQTLSVRFGLIEAFGCPLQLDGDLQQAFVVRLHDDFSALVSHRFIINGTMQAKP